MLLAALGVIGVVAAVATGRVRGGMDEPTTSRPYRALPEQALVPSDVDAVRFSLALRGYRMDEVDEVLGRLRGELADRDAELTRLRAGDGAARPDEDVTTDQDEAAPDAAVTDDAASR